ncbi:MAG: hypothetical protein K2I06_08700, partial [Ruminococcus sp.]|nr:hypothetical protein [Ruminococcus sp.]
MKNFDRFIFTVSVVIFLVAVIINVIIFGTEINDSKLYKIEINRIEQELTDGKKVNADNYDTITGVYQYNSDMNFYNSK